MSNAFGGSSTSCPGCNGSGHRSDSGTVFRDVTKTKPSHHKQPTKGGAPAAKSNEPSTYSGLKMAQEIKDSTLSEDAKSKLIREIVEYEGSHGKCTETFSKKVRKQLKVR
ncbi:MAG TPA: molecular chaperone DnaJ [Polyangiaceae bacterium]|nr:molecular chaperone DnaJ [Polyangiaceae bacterium]